MNGSYGWLYVTPVGGPVHLLCQGASPRMTRPGVEDKSFLHNETELRALKSGYTSSTLDSPVLTRSSTMSVPVPCRPNAWLLVPEAPSSHGVTSGNRRC